MIVKETVNREDIEAILLHPEIYDTIADDSCPSAENFKAPIDCDHKYIGGYLEGEIIAVMVYHKYLEGNKCHIQVLPKFREDYAVYFGQQSLLFRGNDTLYAEIPSLYENVLAFAKRFGFELLETKSNVYVKNKQSYDTNVMRLRNELCKR